MWVEELSDAAWPLGGFTRACNKCYSCRVGIHHSGLFWQGLTSQFAQDVLYKGTASKTVVRKVHLKSTWNDHVDSRHLFAAK